MNSLWTDIAARANLVLSDEQHAALARYLDLLLAANETMNLTRIVDRPAAELLHVADALTLLKFLPAGPHWLADLGSGGGVPGIPLAIARPDAKVLLIESTKKKANFLRETAEALKLTNVEVTDSRVEDVGHSFRRDRYDVVTARAVGLLPWIIEWGIPLLRKGGWLLAMKGEKAAAEVEISGRARGLLRASEPILEPAELPEDRKHVIVRIMKQGPTVSGFPRLPTTTKGKHL